MTESLADILRKLPPSGPNGFEGLIAAQLQELTGQRFHLAKSGAQQGRDISSHRQGSNVIAVETKRYRRSTPLNERELLGEIQQATESIIDLDIWVLVASRDVDSQLDEQLRRLAHQKGIEYLSISADDGNPSSLDVLCANTPDLTKSFLKPHH